MELSNQKTSASLDELERELGLTSDDAMFGISSTWSASSGAGSASSTIESAKPQRGKGGCVPIHWVCGIFTGSLPPEQACLLLDWTIIHQERYAGLYFAAALLDIFSEALLELNGAQLRSWFSDVSTCSQDWHLKLRPSRPTAATTTKLGAGTGNFIDEHLDVEGGSLSWTAFTNGWIHAASGKAEDTTRMLQ